MNIEDYRMFCLSLGGDVEEKMPFVAFKAARGVVAFYVGGHIFCFFDCDNFGTVTLKCQPELIAELKERFPCVGNPYNMSHKHWIGVDALSATDSLLTRITRNSYLLVKG